MKQFKRMICLILTVVLAFSMLPLTSLATEYTPQDNSEISVEGSDGLGNLLSQKITAHQESTDAASAEYEDGYSISDLTISGNTATVRYSTRDNASVVVSLYTEDGMQMLTSANLLVEAGSNEATLNFPGQMPAYFQAAVFLLDTYDYAPLCPAYRTSLYTREMQELLDSTTADYAEDRVINLDSEDSTNFLVCEESTIVINRQDGTNRVVSTDDEAAVYVFENPDSQITNLKPKDIFVYPYDDDSIMVVKIKNITYDDGTATITGSDVDLEEVFEYIKIEGYGSTDDATLDESQMDEGVSYDPSAQPAAAGNRAGLELGGAKPFVFKINIAQTGDDDKYVKANGTVTVNVGIEFKFYVTTSYQMLEVVFQKGFQFGVGVEAQYGGGTNLKLGELSIPVATGVKVKFVPKFVLKVSGSASFNIGYTSSNGFLIEHDDSGWRACPLEEEPNWNCETEFTGEIFVGISMVPAVKVFEGAIVEADVEIETGFSLKGTMKEESDPSADVIHDCVLCSDIDLGVKLGMKISLQFLKSKKLKLETTILDLTIKLGDFYTCIDHAVCLAPGKCPEYLYQVTLVANDGEGNPVNDSVITIGEDEFSGPVVSRFLKEAKYSTTAIGNGDSDSATIYVASPTKHIFILETGDDDDLPSIPLGPLEEEDLTDESITESGETAEGWGWRFHANGWLEFYGSGTMPNFHSGYQPWKKYIDQITRVTLEEGILNIGNEALWGCKNLTSVVIPESVTVIGERVFFNCTALNSIALPSTLTTIGTEAFRNTGLTGITTPASITSIGDHAFYQCKALTSATVNGTDFTIGKSAFSDCDELISVNISGSATSIGAGCFKSSEKLQNVTIPETVTSVGEEAFYDCTALTSAALPAAVTTYSNRLFFNCTSLSQYTFPDTVTTIGSEAFRNTGLTGITTPASVDTIGDHAFYQCRVLSSASITGTDLSIDKAAFSQCPELTSANIYGSVVSIGAECFYKCEKLQSVSMSDTISSIGSDAFYNCKALTSVNLPASLTALNDRTFFCCTSLSSLNIPNTVTHLGTEFIRESAITSITVPASVTVVAGSAFLRCYELKSVTFLGDAPALGKDMFLYDTLTVYYPGGNYTWTSEIMGKYGGKSITWVPTEDWGGGMIPVADSLSLNGYVSGQTAPFSARPSGIQILSVPKAATVFLLSHTSCGDMAMVLPSLSGSVWNPVMDAAYGGNYGAEKGEDRVIHTAVFTDLVPGGEYVLLSLVSLDESDILAPENLLFIDQASADENGKLNFRYVQREETEISYVIACGPSARDLKDATVTFPEMTAGNTMQVVNPTVVYEGRTLNEGTDYVITGTVSFSDAGTYTCYIRGIHNYAGLVECTYTVAPGAGLLGDFNADGNVNDADVAYLLWHTLFPDAYPISTRADFNKDGNVNDADVAYLLWHTLFPNAYPL